MTDRNAAVQECISILESNERCFSRLVAMTSLDIACDFRYVDLSGMDFLNSNLDGFDFTGSSLINADLSKAFLGSAIFRNANLRGAKLPESNVQLTSGILNILSSETPNAKWHLIGVSAVDRRGGVLALSNISFGVLNTAATAEFVNLNNVLLYYDRLISTLSYEEYLLSWMSYVERLYATIELATEYRIYLRSVFGVSEPDILTIVNYFIRNKRGLYKSGELTVADLRRVFSDICKSNDRCPELIKFFGQGRYPICIALLVLLKLGT